MPDIRATYLYQQTYFDFVNCVPSMIIKARGFLDVRYKQNFITNGKTLVIDPSAIFVYNNTRSII